MAPGAAFLKGRESTLSCMLAVAVNPDLIG